MKPAKTLLFTIMTWLWPRLAKLFTGDGSRSFNTIPIDGVPYLTRFFIVGRNAQGKLQWFRECERVVGEGRQFFLHFFHTSDQDRELHNHPWTGKSYILLGGYREERKRDVSPRGDRKYITRTVVCYFRPFFTALAVDFWNFLLGRKDTYTYAVNRLDLRDYHRADLLAPERGCWTLFVTGPRAQSWGFLDENENFHPYMTANEKREGSGPHARGVRLHNKRVALPPVAIDDVDEEGPTVAIEMDDLTALLSEEQDFWPGDRVRHLNPMSALGTVVTNEDDGVVVQFDDLVDTLTVKPNRLVKAL